MGGRYFPFVFCLFVYILILNVAGLFSYIFTPTSHIVLTLGLSNSIVLGATILGIGVFKGDFLSLLMPGGAPLVLGPVLVLIETASYLTRIISLGVRLAANICAGHLLLSIICGFVVNLLSLGLYPLGLGLVLLLFFIFLLEMAVAAIQAYVFCLLTSIYLADTYKLH